MTFWTVHLNKSKHLLKTILATPTNFLADLAWSHTAAALLPPVSRHIELVARKP